MSNWVDKISDWAMQHPQESMGEWYTRALCGAIFLYCGLGFIVGALAGFFIGKHL